MLHRRDDDLIAGANELAAVAMHYEIDAFGRAPYKDTFSRLTSVDETFHFLARAFVGSCRLLAQVMHAAMYVGMFVFKINAAAVDNHLRHLRRSRVVQIHQRLAVDRL